MAGRLIHGDLLHNTSPKYSSIQIRSLESCYTENAALKYVMQLLASSHVKTCVTLPSLPTITTDSMAANTPHPYRVVNTLKLHTPLVPIQYLYIVNLKDLCPLFQAASKWSESGKRLPICLYIDSSQDAASTGTVHVGH